MPELRRPDGSVVTTSEREVVSATEGWNTYLLDDGTVLRMKCVVTSIRRAEGEMDAEGNPVYIVESRNILVVRPGA